MNRKRIKEFVSYEHSVLRSARRDFLDRVMPVESRVCVLQTFTLRVAHRLARFDEVHVDVSAGQKVLNNL